MSNFHLVGEDDEFKSRSKDIFACFENVKSTSQPKKEDKAVSSKRKRSDLKRTEPGYKTEPDKWVKYSLEDTDVANDRQNTQAALSFLHDIKKRSKVDTVEESGDKKIYLPGNVVENMDTDSKISFKKPTPHTMTEHVVGKSKVKLSASTTRTNETLPSFDKVELDHLEENLSSVEYQADIEAKLDETIDLQKKSEKKNADNEQDSSNSFKSSKSHKLKRSIRKRN